MPRPLSARRFVRPRKVRPLPERRSLPRGHQSNQKVHPRKPVCVWNRSRLPLREKVQRHWRLRGVPQERRLHRRRQRRLR
ncbi:MAG: hypothetical protein EP343_00110 [Deltaproteobacteria bacterium]|nr:MAG: hypothetical protein EP343_00110 [Deltaproteobacteria bacterium]